MTWVANLARMLQGLVTVSIAFAYLTTEEITVWLLFMTLISMQLLADIGLTPTFTRALSRAFAGAPDLKSPAPESQQSVQKLSDHTNVRLVNNIVAAMNQAYVRLSIVSTSILLIVGTLLLLGPIGKIDMPEAAWIGWGVVIIVSAVIFFANGYMAYLLARQLIPQLQRLRAITAFGAACSMFAALELDTGLIGLVLAHQIWSVLLVLGVRRSARAAGLNNHSETSTRLADGNKSDRKKDINHVFEYIWPATWRSGLGILFGYALFQSTGLVYAQFATAADAAIYLFILRLLQIVISFSQAPFYSKLPVLNQMWAQGDKEGIRRLAARGMRLAYWVFVAGVVGAGLVFPVLFDLVNANIEFPNALLWVLFGIGGIVERYGAMHIQIYSFTNHIVWHIANGITGLLYLGICIALVPFYGLYGFALAYVLANLVFYAWYSARLSYTVLESNFVQFDLRIVTVPLLVLLLYALVLLSDIG